MEITPCPSTGPPIGANPMPGRPAEVPAPVGGGGYHSGAPAGTPGEPGTPGWAPGGGYCCGGYGCGRRP